MNLASRSVRLVGQVIDGIVAAVPILLGVGLMAVSEPLGGLFVIGGIIWSLFYYFFADGLNDGRSVAKVWLGMQVVDAGSGSPCTFGQSFVRNLLLAILGPIDWIFIFGERRQRLGDKAAGTKVIAV
ncbi:MAG: RDD family protein [Gemmatimonadota bacterium]